MAFLAARSLLTAQPGNPSALSLSIPSPLELIIISPYWFTEHKPGGEAEGTLIRVTAASQGFSEQELGQQGPSGWVEISQGKQQVAVSSSIYGKQQVTKAEEVQSESGWIGAGSGISEAL